MKLYRTGVGKENIIKKKMLISKVVGNAIMLKIYLLVDNGADLRTLLLRELNHFIKNNSVRNQTKSTIYFIKLSSKFFTKPLNKTQQKILLLN